MKKTFYLFTLINITFVFSQTDNTSKLFGKIIYEQTQNNFGTYKTTLYLQNDSSLYLWNTNKYGINENNRDSGSEVNFYANSNKTEDQFVLCKPTIKTTYTRLFLDDKECLIKEITKQNNWILLNEYKKINNYNCQKAKTIIKTSYSENLYFVWFTNEIPIPFGPMKINGLNGLILQAYKEDYSMSYTVKKIIINDELIKKEVSNAFSSIIIDDSKIITIDDYLNKMEEQTQNIENILNSRREKGSPIIKFKKECEDCNN